MNLDETWIKRYAAWVGLLCWFGLLGLAYGLLAPMDSPWRVSLALVSGVVLNIYSAVVYVLHKDVLNFLTQRVKSELPRAACLAAVPWAGIFLMCAPAENYVFAVGGVIIAVVFGTALAISLASRFDRSYTRMVSVHGGTDGEGNGGDDGYA